jgi:hypothetical protein
VEVRREIREVNMTPALYSRSVQRNIEGSRDR